MLAVRKCASADEQAFIMLELTLGPAAPSRPDAPSLPGVP